MDDKSSTEEEGEKTDEERPTTTIPKYKRGDDVVAWSEVDTEWWDHIQLTEDVHEKAVATYLDKPGVEYIECSRGEETIAGHATSVITILVADEATAKTLEAPDEIDGIPLVVEVGHISDTG